MSFWWLLHGMERLIWPERRPVYRRRQSFRERQWREWLRMDGPRG